MPGHSAQCPLIWGGSGSGCCRYRWRQIVFFKGRNIEKPGSKEEGHTVKGLNYSAFSLGGKLGDLDLGPAGFSRALDIILFINLLQDS